ncbi:MAG: leucyl aminopeptidase [Proteobacteria bacterium]|nr:MAG: leucyl aminopeptidase [Pseudomonadota bacterium]
MKITARLSFEEASENTHVFGVYQAADDKSAPLCTHEEFEDILERLAKEDVFKGKKGSVYFVRALDDASPNLLFAGLGKAEEVTGETLRVAGANIAKRLEAEKVKAAGLDLDSFCSKSLKVLGLVDVGHALAQGAQFSDYNFDLYKSEKTKRSLGEISFYVSDRKVMAVLEAGLDRADAENDAVRLARDLSNEPASHLYPEELGRRATKLAKEYGVTCKVLDFKELKKEKMGALVGVGQGSTNLPCLIVMEYKPKKPRKIVALVGKAVTFDSGGISIKPGAGMEEMKHDMSGGADVLAAFLLAAKLKCENHLVCIIPAAENMPDGNAIVPSAVLVARSGKTIEVQNTDAEGRLILADALDYAQDFKPDVIVDVATLTGAVVMALSGVAAGIMGNDDGVMDKFKAAARKTEERFVELPIFQEYIDDIKSKIADIKNIGGEKGAGSQKGGAFLKEFIRKGNKWIHVDIAGTAWASAKIAYQPAHGASGHTVRTLTQFAMDF